MAVLGKRRRIDSTNPSTPSKRISRQITVLRDEDIILPDVPAPLSITKEAADELASFNISTPATTRRMSRPAKHAGIAQRASPALESIDAHFAISKQISNPTEKKASLQTPPITPRHRDALLQKAPVTPQNRIRVPGIQTTPRTPLSPATVVRASPYAQVRQLFSGSAEQVLLVGREEERRQVADFISSNLSNEQGGCLYVSGPPGTGKSAFIADIIRQGDWSSQAAIASINCMSIKNAAELTRIIASELNIEAASMKKVDATVLKHHFTARTASTHPCLLVLDEVDQLVELDLKLLYSLFEWSMQPQSNLILVGIANALDLTDRLLPRLKTRNIKPSLLPFMPYDANQINDIITTKLKSLNTDASAPGFIPFLQPAAILLCSKKVASQTGDLRKAFDIIKRALILAETDARAASVQGSPLKTPLSENINLSSPPVTSTVQTKLTALSHLTADTAPRATIAHVAKVTAQIFSNGTSARLATLNMQQKAVLCALAAIQQRARATLSASLDAMTPFVPSTPSKTGRGQLRADVPTSKQLYASYAALCGRERLLHVLGSLEFRDVLSGLETLGLVEFVDGGALGLTAASAGTPGRRRRGRAVDFGQMGLGAIGGDERRVAGVVGFEELKGSLAGPGCEILRELLEG